MTYCLGIKLKCGLVFLSDSRTNAGIDQISTFRKMRVYEKAGDRFMVLLSAGNLSISQSVREMLQSEILREEDPATGMLRSLSIWNVDSMFDAARVLGAAVRHIQQRDGPSLQAANIEFSISLILGGQIKGEGVRLFQVYAAGNFIEATDETPFLQIGESKYGKPVLDRVITPDTPLDEAAKCALVSMDSTLKSNSSVGLPLDLAVYEADSLQCSHLVCIDQNNPYFQMLHHRWGAKVRKMFDDIPDPDWSDTAADHPLVIQECQYAPALTIHAAGDKAP